MNQHFTRKEDGSVDKYAWPGGYPMFYLCEDGGVLCAGNECANGLESKEAEPDYGRSQWLIVAADINWEDGSLICDHCGERIESAYAEED